MPTRTPAQRQTEGTRAGAVSRGDKGNRGRGRPLGSKNKPKGLIPQPVAEDLLKALQPVLPPGQLTYLREVIKGSGIDTKRELDTLILLLNRNLWPALVAEATPEMPDDEVEDELEPQPHGGSLKRQHQTPVFRKDVTERLKVLNSLLSLRAQLDKREAEADDDTEQPLLRIFADRSISDRVGVLVGVQSPGVLGDTDGTGRLAIPPRTVSNPPSE
ncbi:MAG TPA: hypothetical protein VLA89_08215 [Gemmatimonadales bacterium]|nr:hypothetical protein [Gemmatimonadales bacterium]